ncbi:hypothetical protein UFOVP95_53 [uncultured Caudovirales phage]|uniref:Uncharacterized protein n=1 Tax=uncultured Caudovirales phage TaxID=2100421 RepID=A0A6J5KYS4_9CAUD|nr:hypothetical protein UFOVP95_53 [uncultured Caudovirales phage]
MAIMRDYKCPRHGYFTAWEPVCHEGCEDVAQVILRAPTMRDSVIGGRSKRNDTNIKKLASDFKMTDIKSTREGEHQTGYLARNNAPVPEQPPADRPGNAVMWGEAGKYNMQNMLGGMVKPVRDEQVGFSPKDANITRGPMAASYVADHDNLKLDK